MPISFAGTQIQPYQNYPVTGGPSMRGQAESDWGSLMSGGGYSVPSGGGGGRSGGGGGGGTQFTTPGGSFYQGQPGPYGMHPGWQMSPSDTLAQQHEAFGEGKFNTIWGTLSNMLGGFSSNALRPGGASGASPEISVGGVLSPQQIQQQVNAARAGNDATLSGEIRKNSQQAAATGFGTGSPFTAALNQSAKNANLGANMASERDIRYKGAEDNAQHILDTQQARESQFSSRQKEDIARRQPYFQTFNSLVSALAGLA